jgi:membrane protease YdiL (CAAX protease family)
LEALKTLGIPLGLVTVGMVGARIATRRGGLSLRDDIGVAWPRPMIALVWLALWAGWIAFTELVLNPLIGASPVPRWSDHPPPALPARVLGIVLLAPIGEELVFRGLLYARLRRTRLGVPGAILLPGVLFAVLHVQYTAPDIALIALDGILLGLARYGSRSLLVPLVMHASGNIFAVVQRFMG